MINAGVPALPPGPHLRWYDNVGRRYSPDLVIQFIYGAMAVSMDSEIGGYVDEDGYLIPKNTTLATRIRAHAKQFATVFYAWVIWNRLDLGAISSKEGGREVLGAGRELIRVELDARVLRCGRGGGPGGPPIRRGSVFVHDGERSPTPLS